MKKQMKQWMITAVLTAALCACGGGGAQNAASSQSAPAQSASSQEETTQPSGGQETQGAAIDTKALYEQIASGVTLPDMASIDPEFNYGISTQLCESFVFYRAKEVTKADTIALFFVRDGADVAQVQSELEQAKSFDVESADGYNPDTFELFSNSEIKTAGNLVYWIVSEDAASIEQIVTSAQ